MISALDETNGDARVVRLEIILFTAGALAVTGVVHGALAVDGRPFSLASEPRSLLYLAGLAVPSLTAFTVVRVVRGPGKGRELLAAASLRTMTLDQVLFAMSAQLIVASLAAAVARVPLRLTAPSGLLLVGQLWVVLGEEFGWRGFLLPRLNQLMGPVLGTIVLAGIWGVWHAPMFLVAESPQAQDGVLLFGTAILAWTVLHAVLQSRRRSVAAAMLLHGATNVTLQVTHTTGYGRAIVLVYVVVAAAGLALVHRCRNPLT